MSSSSSCDNICCNCKRPIRAPAAGRRHYPKIRMGGTAALCLRPPSHSQAASSTVLRSDTRPLFSQGLLDAVAGRGMVVPWC